MKLYDKKMEFCLGFINALECKLFWKQTQICFQKCILHGLHSYERQPIHDKCVLVVKACTDFLLSFIFCTCLFLNSGSRRLAGAYCSSHKAKADDTLIESPVHCWATQTHNLRRLLPIQPISTNF